MRKKYFIAASVVLLVVFGVIIVNDFSKVSSTSDGPKDANYNSLLANIVCDQFVVPVDKSMLAKSIDHALAKNWIKKNESSEKSYEKSKLDSNKIHQSIVADAVVPEYVVYKSIISDIDKYSSYFADSLLKIRVRKLAIKLGDDGVLGAADEMLTKILSYDSLDCEAQIWKGSFFTQRALLVNSPIDKTEWVQRGMREMDLASEIDPNNYEVRIVRGLTFLSLPHFFETQEKGKQDIEFLLNDYDSNFGSEDRCKILAQVSAIGVSLNTQMRSWTDSLKITNNCK